MKTIKDQLKELEQAKKEHDQKVKEQNLEGISFEKTYSNGDLVIYKRTTKYEGRIFISFISSVHWTEAVELTYDSRYGKNPEWHLSYGSGGTVSAEPTQIAEVMSIIFQQAKGIMSK